MIIKKKNCNFIIQALLLIKRKKIFIDLHSNLVFISFVLFSFCIAFLSFSISIEVTTIDELE